MNSTMELINQRKSIRAYEDKEIPQNIKEEIIKAALRAPTAGNQMLYSIIDITDQNKKNKLAETCDNQPFIAKAPMVLIFLADYQRQFNYFKHCGIEELCRKDNIKLDTPQEGDLFLACSDASIAAHTAVLAAEAFGIGSCYIGDIMEKYEEHKELLKLPQYTFPIAMLCFGYPNEQQKELPQTKRFEPQYIVYENEYKLLSDAEYDDMYNERQSRIFKDREEINGSVNFGQLLYKNKYNTEFRDEMNRSVREILKNWKAE